MILGALYANLHKNMGWDVVKVNYLGDWVKQIGTAGRGVGEAWFGRAVPG
jgi:arginyl-tRNA synthetase